MFPKTAPIFILLLALTFDARGQQWKSPDGVLLLTPPDSELFEAVAEPPPPFLVLWISKDDAKRFVVMTLEIPPGIALDQASIEEGLAKELKAKVTRLPTVTISGHEIWKMSAKTGAGDFTQAIFRHKDTAYKVIAADIAEPSDSTAVEDFLGSIAFSNAASPKSSPSVAPPSPASRAAPASPPPQRSPPLFDMHNLSKLIGSVSVIALIVGALLYFFIRSSNQNRRGRN